MSRPKHMMEIMSEGYPTNACERLEEAARQERIAERLKGETREDIRAGRKVCGPCRRSKGPRYRFPFAGCEHRRAADGRKARKARSEARRRG